MLSKPGPNSDGQPLMLHSSTSSDTEAIAPEESQVALTITIVLIRSVTGLVADDDKTADLLVLESEVVGQDERIREARFVVVAIDGC